MALFNFTGNCEAELSFSCGEKLELLNISKGSWWKARSLLTNKKGYIPNNYVERYDYLKKYEYALHYFVIRYPGIFLYYTILNCDLFC